ncbi:MAG: DoxX family protein [Acidimicrobiia bacterium]
MTKNKLFQRLGDIALSSMFVWGGYEALKNPGPRVGMVKGAVELPNTELLVQANAVAMLVGGAGLATGIARKKSALLLAATIVPTTLIGHQFWKKEFPHNVLDRHHFLKNTAMLGGLINVLTSETTKAQN